jgi:DNA-binding LacI/PurR family transcriptional regulator
MENLGRTVIQWKSGMNSYEAGCQAARSLIGKDHIDGAFCITDRVALGFLNTARFELSKTISGDISLVGFNNNPESAWPSHALTTISQPVAPFIDAVMSCLARDRNPDDGPYKFMVPVELIERQTTRQSGENMQIAG